MRSEIRDTKTVSMEIRNIKEPGFVALVIVALTALSVLQSPEVLRSLYLPQLILGQLLSLTTVVGIVILLDRHLFRHWFGCSFLKIAGTRVVMQLIASAGIAAVTVYYYHSLSENI